MLRMVLTWPSSASMLCPDRRSHILPAAQHAAFAVAYKGQKHALRLRKRSLLYGSC